MKFEVTATSIDPRYDGVSKMFEEYGKQLDPYNPTPVRYEKTGTWTVLITINTLGELGEFIDSFDEEVIMTSSNSMEIYDDWRE